MKEVHHQEELAQKEAEKDSRNTIVEASLIEDHLHEEDIAWQNPLNHQLEVVPAFQPPAFTLQNKKTQEKKILKVRQMVQTLNDLSHLILLIFYPLDLDVHYLKTVPAYQLPAIEWRI